MRKDLNKKNYEIGLYMAPSICYKFENLGFFNANWNWR